MCLWPILLLSVDGYSAVPNTPGPTTGSIRVAADMRYGDNGDIGVLPIIKITRKQNFLLRFFSIITVKNLTRLQVAGPSQLKSTVLRSVRLKWFSAGFCSRAADLEVAAWLQYF
jgi:hypothetical protein